MNRVASGRAELRLRRCGVGGAFPDVTVRLSRTVETDLGERP